MPDDLYAADAAFYDAIHDEFDNDTGLWLSFAGQTERPVLVVGCGTGRIAVPLAMAGHDVTAIDPSPSMLALAQDRSERLGAALTLLQASLDSPALAPGRFGFVLVPADVFLYCSGEAEQLAWLERIAALLVFNGRLAIDLPGPSRWLDPASNGQPLLAFRGVTPNGTAFEAWHVHEDDLATQTRTLNVNYETVDSDGTVRRRRSEHRLRYVYPAEATHLVARAGLKLHAVYGGYDLAELCNDSDRMIVIAGRAKA